MNIKYNKKKQELKSDPVITALVKAKEFVLKNNTAVIGGLVVILFVLVGVLLFNRAKESSIRQAQEMFGLAVLEYNQNNLDEAISYFGDAANSFSHTPQGKMSAYMLGGIYYSQDNFDEAIKWFERAVSNKSSSGFIGAQALVGLGVSHEASGNSAKAMEYYRRALRDDRIAFQHPSVRWKMALLSRSENSELATELCKELISDTTATYYHQEAKNLLASMEAGS
ncbi:hypothetical protein CHISP_2234 [Chitinispirillum alkaliphilum]|nr:hypothetical protein CHISP_2234 [Chitinispirillum alkaliphilum]